MMSQSTLKRSSFKQWNTAWMLLLVAIMAAFFSTPHNPQVTLMRTNAEECAELGKIIAEKANANPAPTVILNPLKTVSVISAEGQPFYDPEADKALFNSIHQHAKVEVIDFDEEINSEVFAKAAAHKLLELIGS